MHVIVESPCEQERAASKTSGVEAVKLCCIEPTGYSQLGLSFSSPPPPSLIPPTISSHHFMCYPHNAKVIEHSVVSPT